ncbi:MAG: SBBP repeat-containing protein [Pseudomonadota bacterium]
MARVNFRKKIFSISAVLVFFLIAGCSSENSPTNDIGSSADAGFDSGTRPTTDMAADLNPVVDVNPVADVTPDPDTACTFVICNGTCCADGQVCANNACCTPDCTGRVCGPDPTCGRSCGICSGSDVCDNQGQCVAGAGWAINGESSGLFAKGYDVAVDSNGDVFVTGGFETPAIFGSTTLTSAGDVDIFVAKISSDGQVLWAISAGGTGLDDAQGIAVDASGNAFIAARVAVTGSFGSFSVTSTGNVAPVVAKVSSSGQFLWAEAASDTLWAIGTGIAVDASGNAYMVGEYRDEASFGGHQLVTYGIWDVFVTKISPSGQFLWATGAGSPSSGDKGSDIAVDANGNSYITGTFSADMDFGTTRLTHTGTGSMMCDMYVAKLDPTGRFLWAESFDGPTWNLISKGIAANANGDTYVTGSFRNTAIFGSTTLSATGTGSEVFVAKLESAAGQVVWATSGGSAGADIGEAIEVDGNGNAYVVGSFENTADFGNAHIVSQGSADVFVAKVSHAGQFAWATAGGGVGSEYGYGLGHDVNGNTFVTGRFVGTSTFGSTTLTSSGTGSIFVWGLHTP